LNSIFIRGRSGTEQRLRETGGLEKRESERDRDSGSGEKRDLLYCLNEIKDLKLKLDFLSLEYQGHVKLADAQSCCLPMLRNISLGRPTAATC